MRTDLIKQFRLSRDALLKSIREISEEEADAIPRGFRNSIRWNIGHVYTSADRIMVVAGSGSQIPAHYKSLFMTGTSPQSWSGGDIPSLPQLTAQLEQQRTAIPAACAASLDDCLETPFRLKLYEGYALDTIGEVLNFFAFHEAMHIGTINALKRAIRPGQLEG